jgi:hypothetical protein
VGRVTSRPTIVSVDIALPDGVACRLARDCATDAWTVDAVYD